MNFEKLQRSFLCFSSKQKEYYQEYWIGSHLYQAYPFQVLIMLRTVLSKSKSLHDASICGHFYRVSHQQSNWHKFKDFKTFKYYGIRIETFRLTAVEYRLWNQNSNYMMKNTSRGPKKFVWFRWFFELCEFELKEFFCKGLLVNSDRSEEFIRFG